MSTKKWVLIGAIVLLLLISNKVSAEKLIAQFEGLRLKAYQDSVNVWTIGYGSTKNPYNGEKVKQGDVISKTTALDWLKKEIEQRTGAIQKLVKVPINSNQLAALTSLAYNIGLTAFQKSTLLRLLNDNRPKIEVADQFMVWVKAGGKVLPGLVKRRQLEKDLFLS